jgi:hypothetical protein
MVSQSITRERISRLAVGTTVLSAAILSVLHHPYWIWLAAGVSLNLLQSALTERCAVKSLLIQLGVPGERDIGREEALRTVEEAQRATS